MRVRVAFSVWDDFDRPWQVSGEIGVQKLPAKGDPVDIAHGLTQLATLGFPSSLIVEDVVLHPSMKRGEETFTLLLEGVDAPSPDIAKQMCDLLEERLDFFVDPRD